jgi:hypothetical protein
MKKILAAVAVVFAAVGLQAAVVAWGTDAIKTPGEGGAFTGTNAAKGSVTGYLWEVDAATYAIYAAALDTVYTEFQKDGYGALGATTAKATSGTTRKVNLTGTTQYAEGDTAYAIVLYTYMMVRRIGTLQTQLSMTKWGLPMHRCIASTITRAASLMMSHREAPSLVGPRHLPSQSLPLGFSSFSA